MGALYIYSDHHLLLHLLLASVTIRLDCQCDIGLATYTTRDMNCYLTHSYVSILLLGEECFYIGYVLYYIIHYISGGYQYTRKPYTIYQCLLSFFIHYAVFLDSNHTGNNAG